MPTPRVKPIVVFRKPKGCPTPIPGDTTGILIIEYRLAIARPGAERMRQRVAQSTGIRVRYKLWNAEKQEVRGTSDEARRTNDLLKQLLREAEDACLALRVNKLPASPAKAKAVALGHVSAAPETLLQSWQRWGEWQWTRVAAGEIQRDTAKLAQRRLPLLLAWLKAEKLEHLLTQELTAPLCRQFARWLLTYYPTVQSPEFAAKCGRLLAEAAQCAVERGALGFNPVGKLKMSKAKSKPLVYLEPEQVKALATAELPTANLRRCRDAFLFLCYTGFAYTDARSFDPVAHVRNGWVVRPRQKSNETAYILLLPEATALLQRYAPAPIPMPSNSKMNELLKELAAHLHLPIHLTCHVGRRTCGMLLLNAGMSMESVSKWLGHASIKMTEKLYAHVTQRRIEGEARDAGLI